MLPSPAYLVTEKLIKNKKQLQNRKCSGSKIFMFLCFCFYANRRFCFFITCLKLLCFSFTIRVIGEISVSIYCFSPVHLRLIGILRCAQDDKGYTLNLKYITSPSCTS